MHRYLVFLLDEIYLKNVYYLPKSIFYKQLWSIVFLKVPPESLLKPDRQKNLEVDRATDVFFLRSDSIAVVGHKIGLWRARRCGVKRCHFPFGC